MVNMIECDVLVVGGGPAGSSAARAASLRGAKTLFIDKKEEIGVPVQCAEGIGKYLIPHVPFKIPTNYFKWRVDGMLFWIEGIKIERRGGFWEGYTIDRKRFDKLLAKNAIETGAELWNNCELLDAEFDDNGNMKTAIVKKSEKEVEIYPDIVIGADGSESTVLKILDLFNPGRGDIGEIYSWEMKSVNNTKPKLEQIFVGDFTPGGYAYIFPKSKDIANVGIGGLFPQKKMEKYFDEFLEVPFVKKQVKNAEFVVEKSKKSIWSDIIDKWAYNNILLAGDAANQNLKPFVEGILPAIICGNIAGELASRRINSGMDLTKIYEERIKEIFQDEYKTSKIYMKLIKDLFMSDIPTNNILFGGLLSRSFQLNEIEKLKEMNYEHLFSLMKSRT